MQITQIFSGQDTILDILTSVQNSNVVYFDFDTDVGTTNDVHLSCGLDYLFEGLSDSENEIELTLNSNEAFIYANNIIVHATCTGRGDFNTARIIFSLDRVLTTEVEE